MPGQIRRVFKIRLARPDRCVQIPRRPDPMIGPPGGYPALRMHPHTSWPLGRRGISCAAAMHVFVATVLGAQGPADPSLANKRAPVARAHPTQKPPVVNGRLDDEAWRDAEPFAGFVQRELHEGKAGEVLSYFIHRLQWILCTRIYS